MSDLQFSIRLSADGSAYVNGVRVASQETERLSEGAKNAGKAVDGMTGSMTGAVAVGSELGRVIGDGVKRLLEWSVAGIEGAAALKDFSDATGSSVESLSRLTNIAKISGVAQGELGIAVQRLSVNLARSDEEGLRAARALETLGIKTRDPAEAMQQLADKLATYADGSNKAALVQEILGRGAQRLLPYLKDLAEQHEIGATVTTEQAQAAETLEKQWRALGIQAGELRDAVLSDVVPALSQLLGVIKEFGTTGLFGFLSITPKDKEDAVAAVAETERKIADLRDTIRGLSADSLAAQINRWLSPEDLAVANKQLDALLARLHVLQSQAFQPLPGTGADSYLGLGKQAAPTVPGRATTAAAKASVDELAGLAERWKTAIAAFDEGIDDKTIKGFEELNVLLHEGRISTDEFNKGVDLLVDHDSHLAAGIKELNEQEAAYAKVLDSLDEAQQKQIDGIRKLLDALDEQNNKLRDEVQVAGLTGTARELRLSQLQRERDLLKAVDDVQRDAINHDYDEHDALIAAAGAADEYAEAQKRAFDEGNRLGEQFFRDLLSNGRNAFKNLGRSLLDDFASVLYKVIAQPYVVQIAAAVTGGGAAGGAGASGLGGAASLLQAGGGAGSLFSGASTLLGSGAGFLGLPSAAAAGANLGIVASSIGTEAGVSGGLAAIGGIGTALASVAAFIPYVAIALAIAQALGAFDHGGPKGGGFASIGDQANLLNTDSDNQRYYTPDDQDKTVSGIINQVGQSFSQTLAALGGHGTATFGLGFDTDPQGKADNRVSAGAVVNGVSVFDARNIAAGRDNDTLQKEITLETHRALLAALQASDLPADLAKVLNSVGAATASEDDITRVLAYASALKAIDDTLSGNAIEDAETAYKRSTQGIVVNLHDQGNALRDMAANFDGSTEATTALAQATVAYRQSLVATLVQIKQVQNAVSQMFAGAREQIQTSGLDPHELYSYYTGQATNLLSQISQSNDPAFIQQASQAVSNYILSAFNALPEDEQAANKNPILAYLNGVDSFVNDRLSALFNSTNAQAKDPLEAVRDALLDAANKHVDAANAQVGAANTMTDVVGRFEDAVTRMEKIVITVHSDAGTVEVGN